MDRYVHTSRRGWFSRIGNSFVGALLGVVFIVGSLCVLWWNEGRAVDRQADISAGADAVVSISPDAVDTAHDGDLVHLTGTLSAAGPVRDPDLGVAVDGIRLRRTVEMYQWHQDVKTTKEKHLGGSETTKTVYTYREQWSEGRIDSSRFEHRDGHENPPSPWGSATFAAPDVRVGAFAVPPALIAEYQAFDAIVPATQEMLVGLPEADRSRARVSQQSLYLGADPNSPQIGDVRVSFARADAGPVSILGRQSGDSVTAWRADGHALEPRLQAGTLDAADMIDVLEAENTKETWMLRGAGALLLWFGIMMVLRPISVVADFIPLVGSIAGFGTAVAAFLLAAVFGLGTIAVSWVAHRPLVGVPLLVATLGFAVLLLRRARKRS